MFGSLRIPIRLCSYCHSPLLLASDRRFITAFSNTRSRRNTLRHDIRFQSSSVGPSFQQEQSITVTQSALERINSIRAREKNPRVALRVTVESGGCHGFQYKLDLENISDDLIRNKGEPGEDDDR